MLETFTSLINTPLKMKTAELKTDPEKLTINIPAEKPSLSDTIIDQEDEATKNKMSFKNKLFLSVIFSTLLALLIVQHNMLTSEKMVSQQLREEIQRIRRFERITKSPKTGPSFYSRPVAVESSPKPEDEPTPNLNIDSSTSPPLETPAFYIDGQHNNNDLINENLNKNSAEGCPKLQITLNGNKTDQGLIDYSNFSVSFYKPALATGQNALIITLGGVKIEHTDIRTEIIPCLPYDNDDDDYNNDSEDDNFSGDIPINKTPETASSKSWLTNDFDTEYGWDTDFGSGEIDKIYLEQQKNSKLDKVQSESQNSFPKRNDNNNSSDFSVIDIRFVPDKLHVEYLAGPTYWKIANRSINSLSEFKFDSYYSSVWVLSSGYYRINAQFTYTAKSTKEWEFAIKVNYRQMTKCSLVEDYFLSSSFRRTEVADADRDPGSNLGQALSLHRPCATSLTIYLKANDVVELQCLKGCQDIQYEPSLTYWSMERIQ